MHVCTLQNLAMYREVFPHLLICLLPPLFEAPGCHLAVAMSSVTLLYLADANNTIQESICVKNVNPSAPRVYPNPRCRMKHYARRKHLLWLRLRSYLVHCNVRIKELVPPRLLSARQNSFFSLQTPQSQGTGQQEPRTAHSRETQRTKGTTGQRQRWQLFHLP